MSPSQTNQRTRSAAWPWITLVIDAALVVAFAALGRRSHESSLDLAGVLGTAAPFLIALVLAAALTRHRNTWSQLWPAGMLTWIITVAGGLLLRVSLFDQTAALAFQLVAAGTLLVLLLGRRLVTVLLRRNLTAHAS
ncbi:DUF3054 domain-containing protein [Micrococcus terreus]|uniref:DUF3054 domain-containing protein n=1 Tax=Micrococcus terreus TaxID=574650 RepID=UPI00254BD459|nr:DUF3054 domain-containing protein [Micrococcus terreus]MDK7699957.1 DUF3054 domain-containing protein [Micrococcus terreus]WOO98345.1 DUF3054 domain-containing protein [Micrococcus terreus]